MSPRLASTTKPVAWLDMFHSVSKARARSTWMVTTPLATRSRVRVQRESSTSATGTAGDGMAVAGAEPGGSWEWAGRQASSSSPATAKVLCMREPYDQAVRSRRSGPTHANAPRPSRVSGARSIEVPTSGRSAQQQEPPDHDQDGEG